MNEEEIKIKYILPWLKEVGVRSDEIQLERSFSLRIGRNTIIVGASDRERDLVGARLDVLIRRGDRNLLIVETKAEHLALTDDDRDQAVSYARLVHPIAPYAVVTNGRDYRLYDCLTKAQIQPEEIRVRGFDASFPTEALEEAQELFLRSSKENLLAFCQAQVNREFALVKGTLSELDRKYIPELHVTRDAVSSAVRNLYTFAKPGLMLIGESGRGKTCNVCWAVDELLQNGQPVLFFNGLHIERDIIHAIATEFSWVFGGADNEVVTLKRLARLTQGQPLTIVVDGIDEWTYSTRAQHLNGLISAAEAEKFKLILSCKSSVAQEFLAIRGTPTHTARLAEVVDIPPFSDREFFGAIEKYRRAYAFSGAFEDKVLQEAKTNPFLLRVLFDVAQNGNVKHLTFSSVEFFESYYERLLGKTNNPREADATLKEIAGYLYEHNTDWYLEDDLRKQLGLKVNEEIMGDLFHYGILARGDLSGAPTIGFYFQQLRDYIIAFKANQFHLKCDSAFKAELVRVIFPSMRGDVITLYYRLASLAHKQVLDGHLRGNAQAYLQLYILIVDTEFPAIRSKFRPETKERIGFIGEIFFNRQALGMYGFRPISDKDEEIYFYPVDQIAGKSNLGYLSGADWLHFAGSSNGFLGKMDVVQEVVDNEVVEQLRSLVNDGKLYELNCPALLTESILQTVQHNRKIFATLLEDTIEGVRFPLVLNRVKECLQHEKLRRHYTDELTREKRASGAIQEFWSGSYVTYSASFTGEELAKIEADVARDIEFGKVPIFHAKYLELEELELSLLPCIDGLSSLTGEIAESLFENEAKLKRECFYNEPLSVDLAKNYLVALYKRFLDDYKVFVETNFPTLKKHFQFYANLPVCIWLELGSSIDRGPYQETGLNVYFSKSANVDSSVEIIEGDINIQYTDDGYTLDYAGTTYELLRSSRSTFNNLLRGHSSLKSPNFDGMILRELVYGEIRRELPSIEKALREKYGV